MPIIELLSSNACFISSREAFANEQQLTLEVARGAACDFPSPLLPIDAHLDARCERQPQRRCRIFCPNRPTKATILSCAAILKSFRHAAEPQQPELTSGSSRARSRAAAPQKTICALIVEDACPGRLPRRSTSSPEQRNGHPRDLRTAPLLLKRFGEQISRSQIHRLASTVALRRIAAGRLYSERCGESR